MAFDAGMVAAVVWEWKNTVLMGRVDKISQPEKDEIVMGIHTAANKNYRLCFCAGSHNPRIHTTALTKENPPSAPMFCMLLRKHLSGAKLTDVRQLGFERAVELTFDARDEMGFAVTRYLIAEIMGQYSNLILCDGEHKILGAVKHVDFSTSRKRQVMPGMRYEMPPAQEKQNPLTEEEGAFLAACTHCAEDERAERFLLGHYLGIAPVTAREIVFSVCARTDAMMSAIPPHLLWNAFSRMMDRIRNGDFCPTLYTDENGKPLEYTFFEGLQYGTSCRAEQCESFGMLIDRFFASRDHQDRIKQRAQDILHLLGGTEAKLKKKLLLLQKEYEDCAKKEQYKKWGDLVTANIWQLQRGMTKAVLVDYETENGDTVEVTLDHRLTPAQNAQRLYKRYTKAKHAEEMLSEQMEIAKKELLYLETVGDSLNRAETEADLYEIRDELYHAGYASRMKAYAVRKQKPAKPMEFRTTSGIRVLCGKNNRQNEEITHKLASKNDMWFHVKNAPGSHVIMFCGDDWESVDEQDYTDAAMIAAYYSSVGEAKHVAVDYTQVRNLKKPPQAKQGMVIYHKNWSAYVTPDGDRVEKMRVRGNG